LIEETVPIGPLIRAPVASNRESCTILGRRQAPTTEPDSGVREEYEAVSGLLQNWEWTREMILGGTLAQPFDPDKPFQQVAVEDVGAFAAIAFENQDRWIGREVDLAGDEQTMPEIAETFGHVTGREVSYYQVSWDQFEEQMGEEATVNFRWINDVGYEADIAALRQEYPELTSFERYLRSHGWEGAEVPAGG
jgi:NmrA-like family